MTSWPTMSTLSRWSRSALSGRAGGCRTNTVLTFHIRDGKVAEVWSHQVDLYAVDEFWS